MTRFRRPRVFGSAAVLILLLAPGSAAPSPGQKEKDAIAQAEKIAAEEQAKDIGYWEEVVAEGPEDVTVRLALGNAYALNNRLDEAVREFKKVLDKYPDYKIAWNNLGSAYRAQKKKSAALRAFEKATAIDPNYALAYYNIGVVYDSEGYYNRALEYYGKAVKLDPKLIEVKHNPQVVTNRHIYTVLLANYLESAGALAMPLEPAMPAAPEE